MLFNLNHCANIVNSTFNTHVAVAVCFIISANHLIHFASFKSIFCPFFGPKGNTCIEIFDEMNI